MPVTRWGLRPIHKAMVFIFTMATLANSVSSVVAQTDATTRANRLAYDALRKCFVASGKAHSNMQSANDRAKMKQYEQSARQSYDLSYAAGKRLGLSEAQVTRDLNFTQNIELPKMVLDNEYFLDAVATCKGMGLM